jgi:hypothetical protein
MATVPSTSSRDEDDLLPPPATPKPPSSGAPPADLTPRVAAPAALPIPPAVAIAICDDAAVHNAQSSIEHAGQPVQVHRLSSAEKAQRRLWKNLVVFGMCIVVLMVVFYFFSR